MLSWHHHHRHVPSGGHATGSCRAVAGTAVRRFGLVAGDVCGVGGQMFYVRHSENILRGERGGQRNGGRKKIEFEPCSRHDGGARVSVRPWLSQTCL